MIMPRKQLQTWQCGPCERWVSVEVQPGVSPYCPVCGTPKATTRPVERPSDSLLEKRWIAKP
jgi:hypothetical protein